ncbi:MAG: FtsQ-type POTRA domain-containing protein [Candidatus Doudnabacteria bacterium]|nr:FtsQ-type POTRA domain-containing protein [Candidatus Doudnabacteria bacterium]
MRLKEASSYKRAFGPSRVNFFHRLLLPSLSSRKIKVLGSLVVLIALYYLVISDKLLISEAVLSGNSQVTQEAVNGVLDTNSNNRVFFVKKNHYFLMTHGRLNKLLTSSIPEVREVVKVNRKWPDKIEIEITERNPGFVLAVKDRKFLVDEEGVVLKQLNADENKELFEVIDQSQDDEMVVGEVLSNPKLVAFILSMYRAWPGKMEPEITSVKISSKTTYETQFGTDSGWTVFFDINRSVSTQLNSLSLVLNKHITPKDKGRLAYIDMRSEKWIYYCFKNSPCSSQAYE